MTSFRERAVRSTKPWRRGSLVQRELLLAQSVDSSAIQCRALFRSVGELRAGSTSSDQVIEVVTPQTIKSMGAVIRAQLEPCPEGTRVTISGWPGAALFDWGASKRFVNSISDQLDEWSRTHPPAG